MDTDTREEQKQSYEHETKNGNSGQGSQKSNGFECNICVSEPTDPVVTKCGHIYCWECIYKWINQNNKFVLCPVCKSGISVDSCTPIYNGSNKKDPRKQNSEEETPKRPEAQRSGPVPNQNYQQNNGIFGNGGLFGGNVGQGGPHINFLFFGGFGLLPMLFSLFAMNMGGLFNRQPVANNGQRRFSDPQQNIERCVGLFIISFIYCYLLYY